MRLGEVLGHIWAGEFVGNVEAERLLLRLADRCGRLDVLRRLFVLRLDKAGVEAGDLHFGTVYEVVFLFVAV